MFWLVQSLDVLRQLQAFHAYLRRFQANFLAFSRFFGAKYSKAKGVVAKITPYIFRLFSYILQSIFGERFSFFLHLFGPSIYLPSIMDNPIFSNFNKYLYLPGQIKQTRLRNGSIEKISQTQHLIFPFSQSLARNFQIFKSRHCFISSADLWICLLMYSHEV